MRTPTTLNLAHLQWRAGNSSPLPQCPQLTSGPAHQVYLASLQLALLTQRPWRGSQQRSNQLLSPMPQAWFPLLAHTQGGGCGDSMK